MFRIFVLLLSGSYSEDCSAPQRERSSGLVIVTLNCSMTAGKVRKTRSESTIRARIHTTELSVKFRSEFRTGLFFSF